MILLDTNVLVYSAGTAHPLRQPCRQIMAAVRHGVLPGRTTTPCLLELLHVSARRRPRAQAVRLVDITRRLLGPTVGAEEAVLERAAALFVEHERLGSIDAHLAAAAIELNVDFIVSADRGFAGIPGLVWRAPDDPALAPHLGAG